MFIHHTLNLQYLFRFCVMRCDAKWCNNRLITNCSLAEQFTWLWSFAWIWMGSHGFRWMASDWVANGWLLLLLWKDGWTSELVSTSSNFTCITDTAWCVVLHGAMEVDSMGNFHRGWKVAKSIYRKNLTSIRWTIAFQCHSIVVVWRKGIGFESIPNANIDRVLHLT